MFGFWIIEQRVGHDTAQLRCVVPDCHVCVMLSLNGAYHVELYQPARQIDWGGVDFH